MSRVAAVIVNWNSGARLNAAVRSLLDTSDAEVVVVDNASTDPSVAAVDGGPRLRVVRNASNAGFAGGVNRGFAETATPYILIVNPDVRSRPGAVAALTGVLDRFPRAGAVGGFVNRRYLPRPLPTLGSLARENLGLGPRVREPPVGLARVEQPSAAALMVRRAAFEAVGGFDERFHPAWYEDVDFSTALAASGWECWFEPAAAFEHEGGYSADALGPERFMDAYYANQFRYVRKRMGPRSVPVLKACLLAGVAARSLVRPGRAAGYWRGLRRVMAA